VFRIHDALLPKPEESTASAALRELSQDENANWTHSEIIELFNRLLRDEAHGWPLDPSQIAVVKHLGERKASEIMVTPYPKFAGFAISTRVVMPPERDENLRSNNDGTDLLSELVVLREDAEALLEAAQPQELYSHTKDVSDRLERALALLPLAPWRDALTGAATAHDWGKVDPRFQAMLRGTTPFAVMASEVFLAKSCSITSSSAARRAARQRAELPEGFRHEMLSVQMAENPVGVTALPAHPVHHALALHLIATHHGYGRPFAPLVDDDAPSAVRLSMNCKAIVITGAERLEHPVHALDSGLAERFWQMNRHYGWWGIALLEAVLRLADQSASADPQAVAKS
jgi:CRISPR-associated endonuclease/helicase Cas3